MTIRTFVIALLAVGALGFVAGTAFTEDEEGGMPAPTDEQMAELMELMSKIGENHEWMSFMVGDWKTDAQFWMDPAGEAQETTGMSSHFWVMDGKFIRMNYRGDFMGEPFRGMGFMGFNNLDGNYQNVWMDSMSTAMAHTTGTREGDVLTLNGKWNMQGVTIETRTVFTKKSNDSYVMEEFHSIGGQEAKVMELLFTRTADTPSIRLPSTVPAAQDTAPAASDCR